ncbi:heterokaryon incompatibility [Truncatella angustata]|uniref:Heterokaryon incompatibility n=1 Tax=Truncatella angustata TaxID=152316 RepID=A0A9P8UDF4_9PEZI|nr:heterokaryon incompatibility [Truncatella angustata]KAH6647812.1 heterokaryon incompatibility [Truncatella angustata]
MFGAICHRRLKDIVRDAISATKSLGYRYLWVDKHCIDQSNETDIRRQISQMGNIYAQAEVTIIAAAGQDAT